jgi:PilZ domain
MEKTAFPKQMNRRRSQRRKARGYVKVECRNGFCGLGANLAAAILDIADTGIRLIVKHALELPGEVEVTIAGYGLPKPLKRVARVVWQVTLEDGQFCVGVKFDKRLNYRDWQTLASPS